LIEPVEEIDRPPANSVTLSFTCQDDDGDDEDDDGNGNGDSDGENTNIDIIE
jgi:hypothetical protein